MSDAIKPAPPTFAEWAGSLRKRLMNEGFTSEQAFDLVQEAARAEWF